MEPGSVISGVFCFDCVVPWVGARERCPTCRKDAATSELSLLDVKIEKEDGEDKPTEAKATSDGTKNGIGQDEDEENDDDENDDEAELDTMLENLANNAKNMDELMRIAKSNRPG